MDDILKKLDLYELLEIEIEADDNEIKRAYRKKALKCHPDKNPDDPKAAETFNQLSKALEILCDKEARNAYNKILRARKEQQVRSKFLDSNRKRLKEELEAKEKAARDDNFKQNRSTYSQTDEERLRQEIERLTREGSKILEQQNEYLRQQIEKEIEQLKKEKAKQPTTLSVLPRLKCKWDRKLDLDEKQLRTKFQKCGRISCLVVSKKGNSAIVEFEQTDAAVAAFNLKSSTFQIEWLQAGLSSTIHSKNATYFDLEFEQNVLNKLRERQKQINQNKVF